MNGAAWSGTSQGGCVYICYRMADKDLEQRIKTMCLVNRGLAARTSVQSQAPPQNNAAFDLNLMPLLPAPCASFVCLHAWHHRCTDRSRGPNAPGNGGPILDQTFCLEVGNAYLSDVYLSHSLSLHVETTILNGTAFTRPRAAALADGPRRATQESSCFHL